MNNYVVATIKQWNIDAYKLFSQKFQGNWYFVSSPEELSSELLDKVKPRFIFFPHWSWLVSKNITDNYECVCFHMTDLPYGRGGSPLQNLISLGHESTKLTALRMTGELDAGPIYGKVDLSLQGSARDIFNRSAELVYELILKIIDTESQPIQQQGEVILFERRSPEQSVFPDACSINQLFDHVRMLDAESYPHAYIEYDGLTLEFTNANKLDGVLECTVKIRKI